MNDPGKITRSFFNDHILNHTGHKSDRVIVPPKNGVDVGVISVGNRVLGITTDPFFLDPVYGWEDASWFAFHIIASDLLTSGILPEFMTVDLNLPLEITDEEIGRMWTVIDSEARNLGTSIITGHTARYANTAYPMVGGATMFGFADPDKYVTTEMAKPGDAVIVTKSAALEAAALISRIFPETVSNRIGSEEYRKCLSFFRRMSTVGESMAAIRYGLRSAGITSMHDATEGGILGALYEIAEASGNGIHVYGNSIPVYGEIRDVCDIFGMDPYRSISEGTLAITISDENSEDFLKYLRRNGIDAEKVGFIKERAYGKKIEWNGKIGDLGEPGKDPFWKAVSIGIGKKLR